MGRRRWKALRIYLEKKSLGPEKVEGDLCNHILGVMDAMEILIDEEEEQC